MVRRMIDIPTTKSKVAPPVLYTREQLREVFRKHDINKDGKLSWDEVKAAFVELKACWVSFCTEQGFRLADKNEDKYINIHDQELEHLVDYALKREFTIK